MSSAIAPCLDAIEFRWDYDFPGAKRTAQNRFSPARIRPLGHIARRALRWLGMGFTAGIALLVSWAAHADDQSYSMPDTKVIPFASKDGSREYRLFIGLPRDYDKRTTERFQTIYLLDADYAFPLAQEMLRHATDRGQLKEAIVVGIAYPGADRDLNVYELTRTRDYSPTYSATGGYGPETQKVSGGGPAFLRLLKTELLPYIDANFRTRPDDRMIVGHSYGALFTTFAMLAEPELFQHYLVVSPSLWYDNRSAYTRADRYIASHRSLHADVFYAVGAFENHPGGETMVDDLKAWDAKLAAAHLKGYRATLMVFDGDIHNSVFPAALGRGLRVLDDFAGEAAGNRLENAAK
ncbi:MAG: alpha/beta hydrolase-fold protein [Rhizomicrobium sp.]|jgi:predicted alpha/beta superfamily hydrolase